MWWKNDGEIFFLKGGGGGLIFLIKNIFICLFVDIENVGTFDEYAGDIIFLPTVFTIHRSIG